MLSKSTCLLLVKFSILTNMCSRYNLYLMPMHETLISFEIVREWCLIVLKGLLLSNFLLIGLFTFVIVNRKDYIHALTCTSIMLVKF